MVAFGALAFAITLSPGFRSLDRALTEQLRATVEQTRLIALAEFATWFGSWIGIAVVAAVSVIVLLAFRRWRGAIYLLVTLIVGWTFGYAMKYVVDRARPAGSLIPLPLDGSFPSGHALASFLLYGALAVLALTWVRPRWLAWLLAALAALMIFGIGMSRVVLGVHYFADVLGSWLLGFAWLATTSAVYLALVGPSSDPESPRARP